MSPLIAPATVLGLALGLGLWLVVSRIPRLSRPSLALRLAPYLGDVSDAARELVDRRTADPLPVFGLMLAPVVRRLRGVLDPLVGGAEQTRRRLAQAGSAWGVDDFRARQLLWAAAGSAIGVLAGIAAAQQFAIPIVIPLALVALGALAGFFGRDWTLQRTAEKRLDRMRAELPTVLEFLTLSLSAGEGILDAIRRVAAVSRGELAAELSGVVTRVNTGLPLADSLAHVARTLELPPFSRAIEQVIGALERGTPLADVLRAQAQDSRDEAKRELLEQAGKKEIAMLVPLVFLILPTTIVFAIFPGIVVLQSGF